MKKILVTGASGFIGRHILPALLKQGFDVVGLSRHTTEATIGCRHLVGDLMDEGFVADLFARERFSHVLHLAWLATPGVYWTSPDNLAWVRSGLGLAAALAANGGRRLIVAGSCAEYDWNYGYLSERCTPCRPVTLYGASKDGLRRLLEAYCPAVGLSLAWGRIFFTFGPGEDLRRLTPSVVLPLLEGREAPCTHGQQLRDFLYVEDLALALAALASSDVEGCVNLASGQPLAVADLVMTLARMIGRPDLPRLGAVPLSETEPPLLVADVRRLTREVGFSPTLTLEQAVLRTVEHWKSRLSLTEPQ